MLSQPQRGPGRHSCITGRSVHNQRVERFWRDLNEACTFLLFYTLEDVGLLMIVLTCSVCIIIIFVPCLNHHLQAFKVAYSHHPIRTAGNRSPYQLWVSGMAVHSGDCAAIEGLEEPVSAPLCVY